MLTTSQTSLKLKLIRPLAVITSLVVSNHGQSNYSEARQLHRGYAPSHFCSYEHLELRLNRCIRTISLLKNLYNGRHARSNPCDSSNSQKERSPRCKKSWSPMQSSEKSSPRKLFCHEYQQSVRYEIWYVLLVWVKYDTDVKLSHPSGLLDVVICADTFAQVVFPISAENVRDCYSIRACGPFINSVKRDGVGGAWKQMEIKNWVWFGLNVHLNMAECSLTAQVVAYVVVENRARQILTDLMHIWGITVTH